MKSGFGTYALQAGVIKVGAMAAVNALGDVYDERGRMIAGLLNSERKGLSSMLEEMLADAEAACCPEGINTTLGVIVTNASLVKAQLCKVAGMAHNGLARAIRPVHTTADGDSIYALSVGDVPCDVNIIGTMAAIAMERAIVRAVRMARTAYGIMGCEQFQE